MKDKTAHGERREAQRQRARSKKGMRPAGKWFKSSYRDAVTKRLAGTPRPSPKPSAESPAKAGLD